MMRRKTRYHLRNASGPYPCKYKQETERHVTPHLLELAKFAAVKQMRDHQTLCEKRFRNYAVRKYRCKPQQVTFKNRIRAVRSATLQSLSWEVLGQTEGFKIEINENWPFTFPGLVSTLIHEAQHNWCYVRGRCMSTAGEHHCIHSLGECQSF